MPCREYLALLAVRRYLQGTRGFRSKRYDLRDRLLQIVDWGLRRAEPRHPLERTILSHAAEEQRLILEEHECASS